MARSQRDIERDMVNSAIRRGVGSYIGAGSVLREIQGIAAYQITELENRAETSSQNAKLSQAGGTALDAWGRDLRLPRTTSSRAFTFRNDLNVRFFTSDGTNFDDLLSGAPTIAVGQRIYSADGTKTFIISQAPTSLVGVNEAYAGVRAVVTGTAGNTRPYTLSVHEIEGYETSIKVENRYGIYSGVDLESDASYKARLLDRFIGLEACNNNAISSVLDGFAGVGKFNIIQNYAGAGTTAVIVQPTLGLANMESVLQGIRGRLAQVPASGARILVQDPLLKYISIQSVLRTREPLNVTQKSIIINRINRSLLGYFNGLSIGQNVNLSEIESRIRAADSRIISLGDATDRLNVVRYTIGDGVSAYTVALSSTDRTITIDQDELAALAETNPIDLSIV